MPLDAAQFSAAEKFEVVLRGFVDQSLLYGRRSTNKMSGQRAYLRGILARGQCAAPGTSVLFEHPGR
jgi:hypothetical protein